jgi:2-phosphoglycerate kinase
LKGGEGKSMSKSRVKQEIVISDEKHGLPYSKGLMASAIMATGLSPSKSYEVAKLIEDHLVEHKRFSIRIEELQNLAYQFLATHVGQSYADKYRRWQLLGQLDKPMIILIGGTTGVGKSTIAAAIAHRLGITHIVATDALREVMRAIFSRDLMPTLHESSFLAARGLSLPLPEEADPLIIGFREQTAAVAVGIKAVMQRAVREGLNMIIEGVHVVPGFIETEFDNAFVVPIVITVENEDLHRSHFYIRELQTEGFRPFERYRANFDKIRRIGFYIERLAQEHGISVISSHNLDTTISLVLEEILDKVLGPVSKKEIEKAL